MFIPELRHKNRCVSANMPKIIGSVGRKIFLFFVFFSFVEKGQNVYWDTISIILPETWFRTSREYNNIIVSIIFAILTFY